MGQFQVLEHTADVGILATGDSLAEALAWLARGMFSQITDLEAVHARDSLTVCVASSDLETLAVDWLNELLFHYEARGFLPREYDVAVAEDEARLTATCLGEPVDPGRHPIYTVVKAATYHDVEVTRQGSGWRVRVLLDV